MGNSPKVEAEQQRIVETPGICGGSPRIHGTRIPVWGLEVGRRAGRSNANLLEAYPSLTVTDLEAAWAFVEDHQVQIEKELERNRETS